MANRFNLSITNIAGDIWTVQLTQTGTTGDDPVDVLGNIVLDADRLNNPRENIRKRGAQLFLEADQANTFSELFTEQPKQWQCLVQRNAETVLVGWLENDTIIENWVVDKWVVECTVNDGLKDLANIGYFDDNGNPFLALGRTPLRQILVRCLAKTGLDLDIAFVQATNTSVEYPVKLRTSPPTSGATYVDFFDQTISETAFFQGDDATPFRIIDVLRNIMFAANAMIFQSDGIWVVCWLLQLPSDVVSGVLDFQLYNSDGNFTGTLNLDINQTIGSQINGFPLHWAAENQRLQRRPSLGTAIATYEFGPLGDLLANPQFINNGVTAVFWVANQAGSVTWNADPINNVTIGLASSAETNPCITSSATVQTIKIGQSLKWRCGVTPSNPGGDFKLFRQRVRIILQQTVGGSTTYYLDENNQWVTSTRRIELTANMAVAPKTIEFGFDTVPAPVEGTLQFIIYPVDDASGNPLFLTQSTWDYVSMTAISQAADVAQYTVQGQRLTNPSPVTYEADPVQIGDGLGTIFRSTFFLPDETTETQFGYFRVTNPLSDESLYVTNVVDLLILQNRIAKFFTGGVFGSVPYFSRVTIDGLTGVFMVTGWSFDAGQNLTEIELWEVFFLQNDLLDPPPFFTPDYTITANESQDKSNIKPVIRG